MSRYHAAGAPRGRGAMLVSLTLAAGCVDAVGYLGLGQVFVANMTGNTVLLGLAIGQADGRDVLQSGAALAGFVLGVAVGAAIVERGPRRAAWTPAVTAALGFECLVLVAFAVGWLLGGPEPSGAAVWPLIALSALAMGVQSAAVRRVGVAGVSTTYVTGTLTSLTARTVGWLRAAYPGRSEDGPASAGLPESDVPLTAGVWLAYGAGAVAGGAAGLLWQPAALLLPAAAVAAVVLAAARHGEP